MRSLVLDMVESIKKNIFTLILILVIFSLDRISKLIVLNFEKLNGAKNYAVTSFLNFELIWNKGIAFGLLSFDKVIFYHIITIIIIMIVIFLMFLLTKSHGLEKYSYIFIIGGALGNLYDRIYYKAVPDFIDFHINNFHWFIFNIADIFITVGVLYLICVEIFIKKSDD